MTVASDFSQDTEDTGVLTVEEKRYSLQRFTTYVPYSGTHHRHILDTLLISNSPVFSKFQTKNNAYKNPEKYLLTYYNYNINNKEDIFYFNSGEEECNAKDVNKIHIKYQSYKC